MITYNSLDWLERDEMHHSRLQESQAHGSNVARPTVFCEAATTGLLRLALSRDISQSERKMSLTTLYEVGLLKGTELSSLLEAHDLIDV